MNERIQKLYDVFKEFFKSVDFIKYNDSHRDYIRISYNIKLDNNKEFLDKLEKEQYVIGFMNTFQDDLKYLSIIKYEAILRIYFNKYSISSNHIRCLQTFRPQNLDDLPDQILKDIKSFSKKYYNINLK